MAVPLSAALPSLRSATRSFLDSLDRRARLLVFCHFDADGLSAGAVFGRGLKRLGFENVEVVPSGRGESAFSDSAGERLLARSPSALIVTDLGVNARWPLTDVPTLFVDHHRPDGFPGGRSVVISGYDLDPIPTSAWLAFELLAPLADVDDLAWIAAVGVVGDLGEKAPWERLASVKKAYTAKWLKEAVALVNAARRSSAFDVERPLRLLMTADSPRAVADDDVLHAYRQEVNAELAVARKAAPIFSATRPFALVKLRSAAQLHPLIAQQWRGRLPQHAVIAANTGYAPGMVAFSARTARKDLNLPEVFQAVDLGEFNGTFGHGHDAASGGHLPPRAFDALLRALGFGAGAFVSESS
ncbi:DHH family phosphoesterase [Deinococcus yavapaiensis]|uniref:Single-stranded-DNA-specific exonuclease n=1 Tax=Deinococcus yavapaiensis KR-236 TaxID=694435 RepID=A0A318S8Y2_9DEIO|nr:DHH family phosphoesterase [Deinococcus yavapaiensis]PYE55015.1 single-stranded-DNA-specific exonuclease [Deinococcus yavapaiensis KR-236]